MNETQAIAFLKLHQPLPSDQELSEEIIGTFDEVRKHFIDHPNPVCIPLFLNAFGDGMGYYGVYQLGNDVLNKYSVDEVVLHLALALQSHEPSIRWWAAHWSMDFPSPSLVNPLTMLLNRSEDEDAHYYTLATLGFVLEQGPNAQIIKTLSERQEIDTDPERIELIQEILEEYE